MITMTICDITATHNLELFTGILDTQHQAAKHINDISVNQGGVQL